MEPGTRAYRNDGSSTSTDEKFEGRKAGHLVRGRGLQMIASLCATAPVLELRGSDAGVTYLATLGLYTSLEIRLTGAGCSSFRWTNKREHVLRQFRSLEEIAIVNR